MNAIRRVVASIAAVVLVAATAFVVRPARADQAGQAPASRPPNLIVILTDDQGYGDLGSYGHPTIRTPNIDRLASEGQRWTSFYAAPVCTPSRGQLMTGRLAIRTGTAGGVFHPPSTGGLQPSEITIAEVLKARGYATGMVGKWHLGHQPQYLPTRQGFDSYFGIPYSNDMDMIPADEVPGGRFGGYMNAKVEYFQVPILRNEKEIERPADQTTLTRRYTDEAIGFVRANRDRPFFLYLAHNLPHMPLFRSKEFEGHSRRGLYGDVVEEIDAEVGRLVGELQKLELDRNTVVVFLSDNGPWAPYLEQGGSAGLLRGAKGSNWEGGVRVPAIFWGPGIVQQAVVSDIGSELDLLPTLATLAGAAVPTDRPLDGVDLTPTLRTGARSPRDTVYYYTNQLVAVRRGAFKLLLTPPAEGGRGAGGAAQAAAPPAVQLYNVEEDPSEKFDLAGQREDLVRDLTALAESHRQSVVPGVNQLAFGRQGGAGRQGRAGGAGAARQGGAATP